MKTLFSASLSEDKPAAKKGTGKPVPKKGDKKPSAKGKVPNPKVFKPDPIASRDREVFAFVSSVVGRPVTEANLKRFSLKRKKDGLCFVDTGGSEYEVSNKDIGAKLAGVGMYGLDFTNWLFESGVG